MPNAMIIVANDLRTGRVVYRDCRGDWQPDIAAAQRLPGAAQVDAAETRATADPRVIEPQAIALDTCDRPLHYREQIRSLGPGCLVETIGRHRSA